MVRMVQSYQTTDPKDPVLLHNGALNGRKGDKEQPLQKALPVKLKGVDLPTFSGEDKTDYEAWEAAFMCIVDRLDIPVGEKMLRLLNSLKGRALTLVKDLGYSTHAYERAKDKLDKKYGGERCLQTKHLTALRTWPRVWPRNLRDMEEFQAILERVMIALQDSGPGRELQGRNLSLTAKEKLSEEDVQAYKYWLIDRSLEDNFESLVEWVERRVQIMEEVRCDQTRARRFTTRSQAKGCIVDTCKQDHPPWVCKTFKELPILTRRKLISNTGRCYRCLAAGHHSKDCPNARRCGVHGCTSTNHNSYLHDNTPGQTVDRSQYQLRADASPF